MAQWNTPTSLTARTLANQRAADTGAATTGVDVANANTLATGSFLVITGRDGRKSTNSLCLRGCRLQRRGQGRQQSRGHQGRLENHGLYGRTTQRPRSRAGQGREARHLRRQDGRVPLCRGTAPGHSATSNAASTSKRLTPACGPAHPGRSGSLRRRAPDALVQNLSQHGPETLRRLAHL